MGENDPKLGIITLGYRLELLLADWKKRADWYKLQGVSTEDRVWDGYHLALSMATKELEAILREMEIQ